MYHSKTQQDGICITAGLYMFRSRTAYTRGRPHPHAAEVVHARQADRDVVVGHGDPPAVWVGGWVGAEGLFWVWEKGMRVVCVCT